MDIQAKNRQVWKDEYWLNPWDEGALAIIFLFITMVMLLILLAVTFGNFPLFKRDDCEDQ
ncbi:small integral membrane protein 6 [Suncus etruscus]|uniref:small integral membrane protein 6 n=1 Tax=Suncus etruscus TaxID=109475 RepID=UPI002110A18F|nr:small integral membrane protein 6 [Suncus etruscus]